MEKRKLVELRILLSPLEELPKDLLESIIGVAVRSTPDGTSKAVGRLIAEEKKKGVECSFRGVRQAARYLAIIRRDFAKDFAKICQEIQNSKIIKQLHAEKGTEQKEGVMKAVIIQCLCLLAMVFIAACDIGKADEKPETKSASGSASDVSDDDDASADDDAADDDSAATDDDVTGVSPKPDECEEDLDCDGGEYCDGGKCKEPECVKDSDCEDDEACADYKCEPLPRSCENDGDCAGNMSCEVPSYECVALGADACEGKIGSLYSAKDDCDGVDNDCDGRVDEDFQSASCTEKNQYGEADGETFCSDGEEKCDALVPAKEICDGEDNNGDGEIDENLGVEQCGVGECAHSVNTCVDGVPASCDRFEGRVAESAVNGNCDDGLDNDCDGKTDNEDESCFEECVKETELCDGEDNDCDGAVDEGFKAEPYKLGQSCSNHLSGACFREGSYICSESGRGTVCDAEKPDEGNEGVNFSGSCSDNVDNDCDGKTDAFDPDCSEVGDDDSSDDDATNDDDDATSSDDDDDATGMGSEGELCYPNNTCNAGLNCVSGVCLPPDVGFEGGECFGNGTCMDGLECVSGICELASGDDDDATGSSDGEFCDGVDNDGDGDIDEGNPEGGGVCTLNEGEGACESNGYFFCYEGGIECSAPILNPTPEICDDELDNDCDGDVDEGEMSDPENCGTYGHVCADEEVCVNGACEPSGCSQCDATEVCVNNQCVEGNCTSNSDCGSGHCINNHCGCVFDSECGTGQICENSRCRPDGNFLDVCIESSIEQWTFYNTIDDWVSHYHEGIHEETCHRFLGFDISTVVYKFNAENSAGFWIVTSNGLMYNVRAIVLRGPYNEVRVEYGQPSPYVVPHDGDTGADIAYRLSSSGQILTP